MSFARGNERGVALVFVILVGAAMTAVVSTASFVTIQEFKAGSDNRRASAALSYAEAGVDRMLQYIRDQTIRGQQRVAGCSNLLTTNGLQSRSVAVPSESFGDGSFQVSATVYNPSEAAVEDRAPTSAGTGAACTNALAISPYANLYMLITSTGHAPEAKRVVQQVVKSRKSGFPVGIYGSSIDSHGTPSATSVSVFSQGNITGRGSLEFAGCDPYNTLADIWPAETFPPAGTTQCGIQAPAAAHAAGTIVGEFSAPSYKNCTINQGTAGQSLWDSDGATGRAFVPPGSCPGWSVSPQTSLFSTQAQQTAGLPIFGLTEEDYQNYAARAKQFGIYCTYGPTACTRLGSTYADKSGSGWDNSDTDPIIAAGTRNFVAFFDYTGTGTASSNEVKWKANVRAAGSNLCSSDPAINKSVVIIVRNGGLTIDGNSEINGALIMDGNFKYTGNPFINGTILSKGTVDVGGTADFKLDSCWVNNQSFGGSTQPISWSQLDR